MSAQALLAPDVAKALRKEPQVVSGDAAVLDACAAWLNLVARWFVNQGRHGRRAVAEAAGAPAA